MQKTLGLSNNTAKLHQVFGKKLYASKYSFISEMCQNAVDSHRMAGITEPVVVGLKRAGQSTDYIFYVKDIGLSFDDKQEFVDKVCTILESGKTAEKTDDDFCPMGMHGIGSISVSAYQPNWNYTVVKNNRLFRAKLEEVEGVGLTYDITPEAEDDYEHTYDDKYVLFEVRVPRSDLLSFIQNMKDKLAYFKDILFEFDDDVMKQDKNLLLLNTEFKLFEADDFMVSTLNRLGEMHICLDQYSYSIRWKDLGIPPVQVPVALKFKMNQGIEADLTRENLQFSPQYKDLVMDKIKKVAEWFVSKYNTIIPDEFTDLKETIKKYQGDKTYDINGIKFNVAIMQQFATTPFKTIKFKDVSDEVLGKFITKTNMGYGLFTSEFEITNSGSKQMCKVPKVYGGYPNELLQEGPIKPKLLRYLKTKYKGCTVYKKQKIKLRAKNEKDSGPNYNSFLHLYHGYAHMEQLYKGAGINIWREKIKMFQILEKAAAEAYFIRIDTIKIPADFEANKSKKVANRKSKEEIGVKYAKEMERWSNDYHCKFVEKTLKVSELDKQPYFHIYGTEDQRKTLDFIWTLCQPNKTNKITCVIISEKGIEKLKDLNLHNFMSADEFLKGKHKLLSRIMTAYFIDQEVLSKFSYIVKEKELIRDQICKGFAEDLDDLETYVGSYNSTYSWIKRDSEFMKQVVDLVHDLKLYDLAIWEKFQNVKANIDRFNFVVFFADTIKRDPNHSGFTKNSALRALQDCARHRKIRMDWEHYKLFDFELSSNRDTVNI